MREVHFMFWPNAMTSQTSSPPSRHHRHPLHIACCKNPFSHNSCEKLCLELPLGCNYFDDKFDKSVTFAAAREFNNAFDLKQFQRHP